MFCGVNVTLNGKMLGTVDGVLEALRIIRDIEDFSDNYLVFVFPGFSDYASEV